LFQQWHGFGTKFAANAARNPVLVNATPQQMKPINAIGRPDSKKAITADIISKGMKYIIVEALGYEIPFIFPGVIQHSTMRQRLCMGQVVSAGYVCLNENGLLECQGESVGMKIKSRPQDSDLIRSHFSQ
jgi:hypothetical protein